MNSFWESVDMSAGPHGCWPWKKCLTEGYGAFIVKRKTFRANRVSLELSDRPPAQDECALHHCDNRACCNPLHLYWGTRLDNSRDAISRNRIDFAKMRETASPHFDDLTGHRFGRLSVISPAGTVISKSGKRLGMKWLCVCDCGGKREANAHDMKQGKIRSCGCLILRPSPHKLSDEHAREIYVSTLSETELALKYGVSRTMVRCIKLGRARWNATGAERCRPDRKRLAARILGGR